MSKFVQSGNKKRYNIFLVGVPSCALFLLLAAVSCTTAPPPPPEPEEVEEIEAPEIEDEDIEEVRPPEEKEPEVEVIEEAEEEEFLPLDELTEEKQERLKELLNDMIYLVYTGEEGNNNLREIALEAANDYLSQRKIEYINYTHVDHMLEGNDSLYEKETGKSVSPLRWSAYKFGADVYGEIKVKTNHRKNGDMYYGTAGVVVTLYYTSTGEEWAKASYTSPSASRSAQSRKDAVETAVREAVLKVIQEGTKEVRRNAVRSLQKGISYEIELRNTNNKDIEGDFVKSLENEVEFIEKTEESPRKISFRIDFIGDVTELEETVLRAAQDVESLEEMFLIYQRGNTIAFNTGM
ncbi:MAG: hypothetical protein R6V67_09620 [Spirochaetia bacterium]